MTIDRCVNRKKREIWEIFGYYAVPGVSMTNAITEALNRG